MKSYIYKIWNDINDKLYIGQTSLTIEARFKQHCKDAPREQCRNRPLYRAMNKYGFEHFHIELVEVCLTENVLEREMYWINFYDTYRYGYNATIGGDGKTFYNYSSFINLYEQGYTLKQISEKLNCDKGHVGDVLRNFGYNTLINGHAFSRKSISAYNKQGDFIKSFESTGEAAQWLIDNNLTAQSALESARAAIGRVANGKRKTAYGYIWKHE